MSSQQTLETSSSPRLAPHRRYRPTILPRSSGLHEGEPETCKRDWRKFVAIMARLGLLLGLVMVYRLEGRAFQWVTGLACVSLPVHYALPFAWKKPFFVAVSVAALGLILGAVAALAVVAVTCLLIGLCRAPVAFGVRVVLAACVGVGAAAARVGFASWLPVPDYVWTVVAWLCMFRLIIYMYELKHATSREPLIDALSYFFLLPNFCFQLFPVVDYRTMQRVYFARDIHETQRVGLRMMLLGVFQLIGYRVVYHDFVGRPEDVAGLASLTIFLVSNYLLYLHVAGQFHIACGILHLFGWSLPETHHNFLLARSFTAYWRRINIYWKDFMVRIVFNPVVFALKRRPRPLALAAATAGVFVATWVLHAYQSFWLRGVWGWSVPDALFWGILGLLVMVNVQIDARRSTGRGRDSEPSTVWGWTVRGAQTAATFTSICLLWSLWSSPSLAVWLDLMKRGLRLSY